MVIKYPSPHGLITVLEEGAQVNHMSLKDTVSEVSEGFDGVLGVSIKHLGTGESARVKGRTLFPTASVFKVPVIVEYFRQVDAGKLDPDEAHFLTDADKVPGSGILKELTEGMPVIYRDLLHLMMIVSDNTATDLVASKVGFENVNSAMRGLGLNKTSVTRYCREILFDLVGINDMDIKEMTLDVFQEAAEDGEYTGSWSLGAENNDVSTPDEMTKTARVDRGRQGRVEGELRQDSHNHGQVSDRFK
jgi:beta-lactamase class A